MAKKVLVTGGAGFVGAHTVDALLERGYEATVFDSLSAQVHPAGFPPYLSRSVEFLQGDIRNADAVRRAVRGKDVVYHLAAAVGVGQSMYEIANYMSANTQGTAVLLQAPGVGELVEWLRSQTAVDRAADATQELRAYGLTA